MDRCTVDGFAWSTYMRSSTAPKEHDGGEGRDGHSALSILDWFDMIICEARVALYRCRAAQAGGEA